jgi:hypothetical protein
VETLRPRFVFTVTGVTMKPENRIEKFSTHWQDNFKDEPYYNER